MPGVCEKCLKISEIGSPMECSCGHETEYAVAELLYKRLYDAGKRHIGKLLIARIRKIVKKAGGMEKINYVTIPLEVSENDFFGSMKVDVGRCVEPKRIERVGLTLLKEVIEEKRKELKSIVGGELDEVTAAKVVAYLYDGETGNHARIIVQKISGLGMAEFILGERIARNSNESLIYVTTSQPKIFAAVGKMKFKLTYGIRSKNYLIRISEAAYPLAIVCCPGYAEDRGLFVFL